MMKTQEQGRQIQALVQGNFAVSGDPLVELSTILGSCVAVCLHDAAAGIGGMNHFLLPGDKSESSVDSRFGINLMELLINGMLNEGAARHRLVAKVFGGGAMLNANSNVGLKNAQFAEGFLANEDIECSAVSTGGTCARRIKFHPSSGAVKQLLVPTNDVLAEPKLTMPPPVTVAPQLTLFQ